MSLVAFLRVIRRYAGSYCLLTKSFIFTTSSIACSSWLAVRLGCSLVEAFNRIAAVLCGVPCLLIWLAAFPPSKAKLVAAFKARSSTIAVLTDILIS